MREELKSTTDELLEEKIELETTKYSAIDNINFETDFDRQLIEFYFRPNSAREIERVFGINLYQLNKILNKYNLKQHNKTTTMMLRNSRTKKVCLEKYGVDSASKLNSVKEKLVISQKKANLEKYGVENVMQVKEISDKMHKKAVETLRAKYKDENEKKLMIEKMHQTNLEKYGAESALENEEIKQKRKQTLAQKYGSETFNNRNKAKQTCIKKYGTDCLFTLDSVKNKIYGTKKKNNTFNVSNPEEIYYKCLCEKFSKNNIVRQYKDSRYPFACDFYIKSLDLFIELNFTWTHGGKLFSGSYEDITKLSIWAEKAKTSEFYKNAIYTWTVRDVEKDIIAKKNNLNYLSFYTEEDAINWLEKYGN